MNSWLTEVRGRLQAAKFEIQDDVPFRGRTFKSVAQIARFQLTKFGFFETFFVFSEFGAVNTAGMRRFSAEAFECAMQRKRMPLPCGLFEGVLCIAVAVTQDSDQATQQSIRSEVPPKHFASWEMPVIYDPAQAKLHYFERTPLWGGAYFAGFRKEILRFLGDGAKPR